MDDRPARLGDEERITGRGDEYVRDLEGAPTVPDTRTAEYRSRGDAGQESDRGPERRVEEIRAEIEQTREDMSETIDAIQERLRPRNLVAQATSSVRRATSETVASTTEKMTRGMKGMARQTEQMFQSEAGSNALPLALIGVGAAWLLARRSQSQGAGRSRESGVYYGSEAGYGDYERPPSERSGGVFERIRQHPVPAALVGAGLAWLALAEENGDEYGTPSRGRGPGDFESRVRDSAYAATEASEGESLTDRGREMAERLGSRAEEMTSEVRASARRTTRRAQNGLQRLMRDNPLMVGAAAAVIGAAVGAALPETERENEWMGEAKENVIDRAQDMARSAADRARDAAGDLVARTVTGSESD